MKALIGIGLLAAGIVALFVFSYYKLAVVGCAVAVVAIIINAILMMGEPYETPVCNECGRPIEEGADMHLEDGFEEAPPTDPRK